MSTLDKETRDWLKNERAQMEMDEHVKRIVDAAPPLTPEQASKIRQLLYPSVR